MPENLHHVDPGAESPITAPGDSSETSTHVTGESPTTAGQANQPELPPRHSPPAGLDEHRLADEPESESATKTSTPLPLPDLSRPPEKILCYEVHPDANNFRMMKPEEFERLLNHVKQSGEVRIPLELYDNKIIDGRNRGLVIEYLEAQGFEFDYDFIWWEPSEGETVLDRIIALNSHRRHDTEDELLAAACKCLPGLLEQAEARKEASRFTAKNNPRKGKVAGKAPPPSKRNSREKYLRSTPGILATRFGISDAKARLVIQLYKAVQDGTVASEKLDDVLYGRCTLKAALPAEKARPEKHGKRKATGDGDIATDTSTAGRESEPGTPLVLPFPPSQPRSGRVSTTTDANPGDEASPPVSGVANAPPMAERNPPVIDADLRKRVLKAWRAFEKKFEEPELSAVHIVVAEEIEKAAGKARGGSRNSKR